LFFCIAYFRIGRIVMNKKCVLALIAVLCAGMIFCGCGKNKFQQRAERMKKKEEVHDEAKGSSAPAVTKLTLKGSAVNQVFESLGWSTEVRAKGKEIPNENMFKITDGSNAMRVAVLKKDDGTVRSITIYVKGPHTQLRSISETPAKLRETVEKLSSSFIKGISEAITELTEIKGRGTARRVGNGYMTAQGWKCVVINYIKEHPDGPYMMILEKLSTGFD
jgi:hypothetical protein